MFQFGVGTIRETPLDVSGVDTGFLVPLLWLAGILVVLAVVVYLILHLIRHRAQVRASTFEMVTLLITLPKFRRE